MTKEESIKAYRKFKAKNPNKGFRDFLMTFGDFKPDVDETVGITDVKI